MRLMDNFDRSQRFPEGCVVVTLTHVHRHMSQTLLHAVPWLQQLLRCVSRSQWGHASCEVCCSKPAFWRVSSARRSGDHLCLWRGSMSFSPRGSLGNQASST